MAIEIVVDGAKLDLAPGEWTHYDEQTHEDIYRRPVEFGDLGSGHVVVGVKRKQ